jgi:hypothetical protein
MGKSSAPKIQTSPAETAQANNIEWIQNAIQKPIVDTVLPKALGPLSQAFDTSLSAPDRQNIEQQYSGARNEILNNSGARGGMMQKNLKDAMLGRASDIAYAQNQAKQQGITRALGLMPAGFPGADSTLAASGQLSGQGAQRNAAQANLNYQQQQANAAQMKNSFGAIGGLLSLFM